MASYQGCIDHLDEALKLLREIAAMVDRRDRQLYARVHNAEMRIIEARRMLQRSRDVDP